MKEADNIREVENTGIDLMGFIFYPKSPRYINTFPAYLPQQVKRIGVFVNEKIEKVRDYATAYSLDYIQLHGNESTAYCQSLREHGLQIIKAFPVSDVNDIDVTEEYENSCDLFLFDTKTAAHGGSGKQFNWDLLSAYKGEAPFLLSGGIDLSSVQDLLEFQHPKLIGYDLNSRFESAPGIKDIRKLQKFIKEIRSQNN